MQASSQSCQNEEEKLRRKLSELAGNLSDKGLSSDDEMGKKPFPLSKGQASFKGSSAAALDALKDKELSSSSDEMPTKAQKVRRFISLMLQSDTPQLYSKWEFGVIDTCSSNKYRAKCVTSEGV